MSDGQDPRESGWLTEEQRRRLRRARDRAVYYVKEALALTLIGLVLLGIAWVLASQWMPCPPGTLEVNGWGPGGYSHHCVTQR